MRAIADHWTFLGTVFVASYAFQLLLYLRGGIESPLFPVLMLIPALVAIGFRIRRKEGFRNVGWGSRGWAYLLPAVGIPGLVVGSLSLLFVALGRASWNGTIFSFANGAVEINRLPMWIGPRSEAVPIFVISFLLSLVVQSALGSVVTLGEEFGWRGYVQEKLLRAYGLNAGLVVLGIAWGLWHLPIGLMGWNFPEHPVLGALVLTPASTVFMGVFLGWLYLRSRNIWLPALAHAATNLTAQVLFTELDMHGSDMVLRLSWIAAWGITSVVVLVLLNRSRPDLWQRPGTPETVA